MTAADLLGADLQATFAVESALVIVMASPFEHPADGLPDTFRAIWRARTR